MTEQLNNLGTLLGEPLYVYTPDYIDIQTVLNLLKQPVIKENYRLFLLNDDETISCQIPNEDIIINNCNYSENYQNGQRRSLSISLNNSDGKYTPSINKIWITNKFRLDVGISSLIYTAPEGGPKTYWFPRGVYVLGNPVANRDNSDKTLELQLMDKFAYLEGSVGTLDTTYEIKAGTEIKQVITQTLNLDNGMGLPIDNQSFYYDASFEGKTMPYDYAKDAGGTIGEIFLDIATILDAEVFYNSMGHLTFIPTNSAMNDAQKPILYDYDDTNSSLFTESISYDFENTINSIQVVGDQIDSAVSYSFAENNNPKSPICVKRIGRRTLYVNDSNIYSNKLAKSRAMYELRIRGILATSLSINVAFNPLLFVDNLITLTDSFFNYNREQFLIHSISYNLGADSQMTLTCSNVQNFIANPEDYLDYVQCTSQAQAVDLIIHYLGGSVPTGNVLDFISEDDESYNYELSSGGSVIKSFKVIKENSQVIELT